MTVLERGRRGRSAAWGWGITAGVCGLLLLNATWLYFAVGSPGFFEADTGVSASEFRAAFPGVADELAGRGRTIAVLLGGLAAVALAVAVTGLRAGERSARAALWLFVVVLLGGAANAMGNGRLDVGASYVVWALLAGTGLVLAGRGAEA